MYIRRKTPEMLRMYTYIYMNN